MPIIREDKINNYTVMSNHHLRDMKLSMKARGLLSTILSLPDDWEFSLAGLNKITKESKDAVRSALQELEDHGYLVRERLRINGRMDKMVYTFYENPIQTDKPIADNPVQKETSAYSPPQLIT